MSSRVAYFGHHGFTELMIAVHKELVADGTASNPAFVLFNGYWRRRVSLAFPGASITMLPNRVDWWRLKRNSRDNSHLTDKDFHRAWRLDKVLRNKLVANVFSLWTETRRRLSDFLDASRPAIVVSELIQSMACYALFLECGKRGIPFVQLCGSRIPGGMEYYLGTECRIAFLDPSAVPSDRAMALARALVAEIRSKTYAGPGYMKIQRKKSYFSMSDVRKTVDYLLEQMQGGWLEPNTRPFWYPFVSKLTGRKKYTGDAYQEYCVGSEAVEKLQGKKLLFPLHVTPEASTDLWSPDYADMSETAEMIVKNLPFGWTLVMKEHPSTLLIQRSSADIAALKRVPRSLIVSPSVANDWLLQNTNAAVVVTGTFALEAMMKNIAVITLGRPFYDLSGQTIPCPDLRALPRALAAAEAFRVDEDKVVRFMANYADAVDPGHPANTRMFPSLLNEANVKGIAAGLKKRFLSEPVRVGV